MISARSIRKTYPNGQGGEARVLDGVDLEIRAGEFVAILGPSGSGKSTLLNILGGLDSNYQGEVQLGGTLLSRLSDRELSKFRNQQVGFVFQAFHLLPNLRAIDNVLLPALFSSRPAAEADRQRAQGVLARVGLVAKSERLPSQLSGGERQRVAIARALLNGPKILLCDEPTGNLDERTGAEVIALFRELHREGLTLLAVTHEERISAVAQRVLKLEGGTLRDLAADGSGH
jgi:putative ABC transport system ATP-binding protein